MRTGLVGAARFVTTARRTLLVFRPRVYPPSIHL